MFKTKKPIVSLIAMLLCVSMLVGMTFAWFTDSFAANKNIESGKLDVEMYWTKDMSSGVWLNAGNEKDGVPIDEKNWEPGYTIVRYVKIVNAGDLALDYSLKLDSLGTVGKLAEVIGVYYSAGVVSNIADRTLAGMGTLGSLKTAVNGGEAAKGNLAPRAETVVAVALKMDETAGNEYQKADIGDGFIFKLVASQATAENDGFDNTYDEGALPEFEGGELAIDVSGKVKDNVLTEDVVVASKDGSISAHLVKGTKLNSGVTALTLKVTEKSASDANVTLDDGQQIRPLDVHVEGVAADNTVPVIIGIKNALAKGLNIGNYTLYHVENGTSVAMTYVAAADSLSAHNQFSYDPATGDVTLAMATFSEVAMVADKENAWEGEFDYTWYDASKTELTIANADQLAGFGAIVGGMAEGIERDNFTYDAGQKTVKLVADINLGDAEKENNPDLIFYPIGYYNNTGSYEKVSGVSVTSSVSAFRGVFDGNGHTIANFYQNTWEMYGDYNDGYSGTPNHYKDAMGLFGYVYGGTVKNLTVDNFSSDGEFTPTGVIAAYAAGDAKFENIAITNCNPRVYNTGNGGIIGIAGREHEDKESITLKNITVDNSNKISALWGSWDVACGGLVGMYRGNVDGSGNATGDTISFENCHVSAIIDVYNDVCANYQYYAYRYSGMIIGSVRHNTKNDDGKTIPNMTGISATGCTVNYGDWNDYYYCEFEENTMASYSEDYQFSRVPHSELDFTDSNGNGVVDADERASVTGCTHTHTDAEDKRAVYLPFHQLFTGYSWGVSSIGLKEYSGIVTNLDITEGDQQESVVKFETKFTGDFLYRVGNKNEVPIGSLFMATDGVTISNAGVWVTVTKVDENMKVSGTFTANTTDWTKGKLQFSGTGVVKVTIQDYNFCTPTVIYLEVVDAKNITGASSSTDGTDVVLLNDVKISSDGTVHYKNCTVYGNGFTFDVCGGMNQYNSKQGHGIIICVNATLDNMRIIGDVYDEYGMYSKDLTGKLCNDYTSAVDATNSIIQNCYIANCAAPIRSNGNTIIDTTLYGGTVANLLISGGTNILTNVTTVNYNDGRGVIGMGIVITDGASVDSTKVELNGYLKQYNYVYETDVETIKNENGKTVFNSMFGEQFEEYHIGQSPKAVNTGIISINSEIDLKNVLTDNANTGYTISDAKEIRLPTETVNATVASVLSTGTVNNAYVDNNYSQGDYLPKFEFDLGDQAQSKDNDDDTRYLIGDKNGLTAMYPKGESALTLDLTKLATSSKYTGISYVVSSKCIGPDGKEQTGVVTFDTKGTYTLVFTVEDNIFYDQNGNKIIKSVTRTYEVKLVLDLYEKSIADATMTISSSNLTGEYVSSGSNKKYKMYPLKAITSIMDDANKDGTLESFDFKKNIQSAVLTPEGNNAFSSPTTITITYTGGQVLTIVLGTPNGLNSPGASNGGKTFSVKTDDTNGIYLQSDGAVASSSAVTGTWPLTSWSFKGTSGKVITDNTKVTIDFTKPSSSGDGCVTPDTLITLADGRQVRVDSLKGDEMLLVWNLETGSFDSAPIMFVDSEAESEYEVIKLYFSDGTEVKVISEHGFWDYDLNKYVYLDRYADDYIGHWFAKQDGDKLARVQLVDVVLEMQTTTAWSPVTVDHLCYFVNGMLSMPGGVGGLFNIFEVDAETMTYDYVALAKDIEKYGLFTYEELNAIAPLSEEMFYAAGGQYLKISIAKGNLTVEELIAMINRYSKYV